MTVGGRTSAYVAELQCLRGHAHGTTSLEGPRKDEVDDESDLTPLSDDVNAVKETAPRSRKRKAGAVVSILYRLSEAECEIGCHLKAFCTTTSETKDQERRHSKDRGSSLRCTTAQLRPGSGASFSVSRCSVIVCMV